MLPTKEEMTAALRIRQGEELTEKFSRSTVAVCGLGGLGSNIAISLARAGVGRLILIDFDKIDITNLHRQQYKAEQVGMYKTAALSDNLREIAPYTEFVCHTTRIDEDNAVGILKDADVICEAFDAADSKAMLINTVRSQLPHKYIIAASGMAGWGSVNDIKTRRVSKGFYICGDGKSDVLTSASLLSSRVMACAAHEAHMVLRLLSGEEDA